jgi:hypothetical protein
MIEGAVEVGKWCQLLQVIVTAFVEEIGGRTPRWPIQLPLDGGNKR